MDLIMKEMMKNKMEELLSKEYYCSLKDLKENAIVYSVNFNIDQPYIKILAYRNCVVVCTSKNLHDKVQKLLRGKNRDEIFELPFVYGQTIHYVPGDNCMENVLPPSNYEYEYLFDGDILALNGLAGFENSLSFDENGSTSTKAVYMVRDKNKMIGVAGAAESSVDGVWEIGIDVVEEYRNARLGTYLVGGLTRELLARNIIPFYSASITNIGSQMVACRCGYVPFWVDTYGTIFDGNYAYNDIMKDLSSKFETENGDLLCYCVMEKKDQSKC